MMTERERYLGTLLGLAVGDAVGTALEFQRPETFTPVDDMVGGGPFRLQPGQWTDDTSMALCLADSLIESGGFDAADQLRRYVRWYKQGYMSCTGECFDIGTTTRGALERFLETGQTTGPGWSHAAGNGSLMRLAPVPMFFAADAAAASERSGDSSRTTHAATACVDACRYYGGLIVGALRGVPKEQLLSPRYSPAEGYWAEHRLCPEVDEVAAGSFGRKQPPAIRGTGYVVESMEAALWAFYHAADFRDGCLRAVNLGDDADTTGAIYGQLAGAYYGCSSIPPRWRERLAMRDVIESLAEKLLALRSRWTGA